MISSIENKIFTSLQISEPQLLTEMALLLAKQQLSEYSMEVDYFEKKYGQNFYDFDQAIQSQTGSYEIENDWMSWKFAVESKMYWQDILRQLVK
jgi:hypothetical protein